LKDTLKKIIWQGALNLGYEIHKADQNPRDFNKKDVKIINSVLAYTLTPKLRIHALMQAVKYVVNNNIPGTIVECGVWRGGSIMAAIKTLQSLGNSDKEFYLFDTFEGMTKPTNLDIDFQGRKASEELQHSSKDDQKSIWARVPMEQVQSSVYSTGYDVDKIHFVKGKVEETLPDKAPNTISLLRLDTDWYESTKHELIHLFPKLSRGGIIIIDDYGHFEGAKKAVDDYFSENKTPIFLNRIDESGIIGVKI